MAKTIRFTELVENCGKPHIAIIWSDPAGDPDFAQAIKENRVLTVKQDTVGSHADFGLIGFHEQRNASYFIFPKPLPDSGDARVVGINYDLLASARVKNLYHPPSTPLPKSTRHKMLQLSAPPEESVKYSAVIRRTAQWRKVISVTARNKIEAQKKLRELARKIEFASKDASVRTSIVRIKQEV